MTRFFRSRSERDRLEVRKHLRRLRVDAGVLSQFDVAAAAKLSPGRYQQIENGRGRPVDDDEKAAIAKVFGKPIDEVFPVLTGVR